MSKKKIPVYDICTLGDKHSLNTEVWIEPFDAYLERHYTHLHHPHGHSFYHLVLFTHGKGSHTIDFVKFKVQPCQIYFMIPGQVHSWDFEAGTDGFVINFSPLLFRAFLLNPDYLGRFSFLEGKAAQSVYNIPPGMQKTVLALFREMYDELTARKQLAYDLVCVKLLELFIIMEREYAVKASHAVPGHKNQLLKNFQQLIHQHFRELKLPKEYADLLYVTPNHLNALCQDLAGKTAGELIRERVLLEAKRLLTNADMTVSEIAYNLNFKDNAYFNRYFRKYTSVTPEAFRRSFFKS